MREEDIDIELNEVKNALSCHNCRNKKGGGICQGGIDKWVIGFYFSR